MNDEQTDQIISRVLTPINTLEPCGKWARYGSQFMSISKLREEDVPNLPMGEWERPLVKADWKKIVEQCVYFLEKESKDLQIAIWLCDALVRIHQTFGLSLGLLIMKELISKYWETIWPLIEKDEDTARVAPFIWLNTSFITRLNQDIILLQPSVSRLKPIYLSDWENSLRKSSDDGNFSREKIRDSITMEDENWLNALKEQSSNSLVTIEKITKQLDDFLSSKSPSLSNLKNTVDKINNFASTLLDKLSGKNINEERKKQEKKPLHKIKSEHDKIHYQLNSQTMEKTNNNSGDYLLNRDKAYADLKKIADYLQKIEPHSPTPYLLNKLVKWKNMTLEELVNDSGHEELLKGIMGIINSKKKIRINYFDSFTVTVSKWFPSFCANN